MSDGKPHLVTIEDFSTVLQKRKDQKGEILAQLRKLYDGQWRAPFGNGVYVDWTGKVGAIVCSTPKYDKEMHALGEFGDRFTVWRFKPGDRHSIAEKAGRNSGSSHIMREELNDAMRSLDKVKLPSKPIELPYVNRKEIASLADFATRARSVVERNPYSKNIEDAPDVEGTARLSGQLHQFLRGLLVYYGHREPTHAEMDLVRKMAFSTIPKIRLMVIHACIDGATGQEVAGRTKLPAQACSRVTQDLQMLGLLDWDSPRGGRGKWRPKGNSLLFFNAARSLIPEIVDLLN
jgi:hypothetical protein